MHSIDKKRICKRLYDLQKFRLRKIAIIIGVSHMSVKRWSLKSERELEKTKYHMIKRKIQKSGTDVVLAIKSMIEANPLLMIDDVRGKVKTLFNFTISKSFLCSIIRHKCNMTRKKVRFYGKSEKQDELTEAFIQKRKEYEEQGKFFVSLDETSFSRKGKDVFGYSDKGKKIAVQKPWKRFTTHSALSYVDEDGSLQYSTVIGSYNKERFVSACNKFSFRDNSVVMMDNVKFHHSKEVLDFFNKRNIEILFVPPYSPWFNPIENVFSLVKKKFYKTGSIEGSFNDVMNQKMVLKKMFLKVVKTQEM